jgi:hypothetical protein
MQTDQDQAILSAGEPDELEAWQPEEFDHFTDLGLLRRDDETG